MYCLTFMGFGLNVAPSIAEATLSKDDAIQQATSAYIDNVFINENIAFVTRVRQHLANFGLARKELEQLQNGAQELGLIVWEEGNKLIWEWGNEVLSVPHILTQRSVFSFCGKLVRHFPVVKWLRVAAVFIKKGLDDKVIDVPLTTMIKEVVVRVCQEDLMWGKWCVRGPELDIWVDASSLATGVSLEQDGAAVEDASWLWKERYTQHINLAEVDAVLKGMNMALMWKATILHLHTGSPCMHKWITDILMGKARVHTEVASEILIGQWLDALASLVKEDELSVDAVLVRSDHKQADGLTRVP